MDLVVSPCPLGVGRHPLREQPDIGRRHRYRALYKLGGGSFGDILAAVNEEDPQDWKALKVEAIYNALDRDRRSTESSMVRFEDLVFAQLAPSKRESALHPFPVIQDCICLHDEHDVLVMELLGPNLRDYATDYLQQWPLPQDLTLIIGAVLVGRLQQLHQEGFVHRDIKPENVVLRLAQSPQEGSVPCFLLVDYALATRFAEPHSSSHSEERRDADIAGTHRYMAIHAQKGVTQSRRSDLESLAHMLVYLARGELPWQRLQPSDMLKNKESTPIDELCAGLAPAFARFVRECRGLEFASKPRYEQIQRILLEGVKGSFDFKAARVRRQFKMQLQEAFLDYQKRFASASGIAPTLPPVVEDSWSRGDRLGRDRNARQRGRMTGPEQQLRMAAMPIFVRHESTDSNMGTELCPWHPTCASDLDDPRNFFFEGYTEALPGTQHVVVGARHFFAFFQQWQAEQAMVDRHATVEQIRVFSLGRRDWVTRAAALPDYDVNDTKSGAVYREWNLRSAFWAQTMLLPREKT